MYTFNYVKIFRKLSPIYIYFYFSQLIRKLKSEIKWLEPQLELKSFCAAVFKLRPNPWHFGWEKKVKMMLFKKDKILNLMLISFYFLFFVLVNKVMKIPKYYVIFCLSCKARRARKNKQTEHIVKKIKQSDQKTIWNEPNIGVSKLVYWN